MKPLEARGNPGPRWHARLAAIVPAPVASVPALAGMLALLGPARGNPGLAIAAPQVLPARIIDGELLVGARVDGVPGRYILDTGSTSMALTREAAHRAGLRAIAYQGGFSWALATVDLAGRRLTHQPVVILNPVQQRLVDALHAGRIDGLLGYSVLRQFRLTIDYRRRRVTFDAPLPPVAAIPLDDGLGVPEVDVALDGGPPASFMVDTGASAVEVPEDLIGPQDTPIPATEARYQGVNGVGFARLVDVRELEVGPIVLHRLPVVVASQEDDQDLLWGQALLGYPFLSRFRVTLDGPHRRLYLVR